jgi:hypothetical protein
MGSGRSPITRFPNMAGELSACLARETPFGMPVVGERSRVAGARLNRGWPGTRAKGLLQRLLHLQPQVIRFLRVRRADADPAGRNGHRGRWRWSWCRDGIGHGNLLDVVSEVGAVASMLRLSCI